MSDAKPAPKPKPKTYDDSHLKVSSTPEGQGFLPRYRVNAKQKASGEHYLDCTVEVYGAPDVIYHDTRDEGDAKRVRMTEFVQYLLRDMRKQIEADGGVVVDPPPRMGP